MRPTLAPPSVNDTPSALMVAVPLPTVAVGPFRIADAPRAEVTAAIVELWQRSTGPVVACSLHIGGLLHQDDPAYLDAMRSADVAYADGAAIVLLARRRGARRIERCPTTDHGHRLIDAVAEAVGRPARVALVGGPPGLAERAGHVLEANHRAEIVATVDGFRPSWDDVVDDLARTAPDILFIGIGTPAEKIWAAEHAPRLGHTIVNSCGGWFAFVTGEERRAPRWMMTLQMEWVHRLAHDPRRLTARYVRGAGHVLRMLVRPPSDDPAR